MRLSFFLSLLFSTEALLEGCEKQAVQRAVRTCALYCTRKFLTVDGCDVMEGKFLLLKIVLIFQDAKGGSRMAVLKMAKIPYCEMAFQEEIVKCFT